MNVVKSHYTFDEKVLIYADYDELLHEILAKMKKYYEVRTKNKWGSLACLSGSGAIVSIIFSVVFYKHTEYVSFILALLSLLLSVLIAVFCIQRISVLEQKYKQIKQFLESELSEITNRDNEVRSLRLIERRGFNKIVKVDDSIEGYHYVYFDKTVYTKPCIIDSCYFGKDNNTLDLSIYDDYYDEVQKRIELLRKSKTLHSLDKIVKK